MSGRLIICPTPIGNLEDVTLRVLAALRDADVVQRLAAIGCAPIIEGTAEFATLIVAEQARNAAIIRAAGIQPE